MNARQLAAFSALSARSRAASWPAKIRVTVGDVSASLACAKSATQMTRMRNEQDTGWIQRAVATFLLPASGNYIPDIGATFTLLCAPQAPGVAAALAGTEADTRWRCFDLHRSTGGAEHRCICFRLDD